MSCLPGQAETVGGGAPAPGCLWGLPLQAPQSPPHQTVEQQWEVPPRFSWRSASGGPGRPLAQGRAAGICAAASVPEFQGRRAASSGGCRARTGKNTETGVYGKQLSVQPYLLGRNLQPGAYDKQLRVARSHKSISGQHGQLLPTPRCDAVRFPDPRGPAGSTAGLIAFYYPDRNDPCDVLCSAGFLGNSYDLGVGGLHLKVKHMECCGYTLLSDEHHFRTAEAAFQALKFWARVRDFEHLTGTEAFSMKQLLRGNEDWNYSGFGDNWKAMRAVLRAKFQQNPALAEGLLRTEDAFLLEHNSVVGRDDVWSDNGDGGGMNWLGLQLMLIREEIQACRGTPRRGREWLPFIGSILDLDTGDPLDNQAQSLWRSAVRSATEALGLELRRGRVWSLLSGRKHTC